MPDAEQMQLTRLVMAGKTNGEIANEIKFCTTHAVKKRLSTLYRKAGVKNRIEFVKKAIQERWGETEPIQPIDLSHCKNSGTCQIIKDMKQRLNMQ